MIQLPPTAGFGGVSVDFVRRDVLVNGEKTHLSRREFDLLAVLLSPARRVRTRDELIDLLWPDRTLSDSRTLDTHIHRLRAKLEPDPTEPRFIVTVRGVGFRIEPGDAQHHRRYRQIPRRHRRLWARCSPSRPEHRSNP